MVLPANSLAIGPPRIWPTWTFEPAVVVALVLAAAAYVNGLRRLWARAGAGHGVQRRHAATFAAGWVILALSLCSPLHELGESMFSAHMVQHELLMVVAAPLLILGRPLLPWLWAIPMTWRRRLGVAAHHRVVARTWKVVSAPLAASSLHALVIWGWHAPSLYDASVTHDWIHAVQHTSFLGSAMLFWWTLIGRTRSHQAGGTAIVYMIATAAHTGALGALLTFAPQPIYAVYQSTSSWGMTPLEDQQLAGLIMWIPAGMAYLIAALVLTASWLNPPIRSTPRWMQSATTAS